MQDRIYIVCGGTGGHLAPGIATAQRLIAAGVRVELVISEKDVDSRLMQAYPDIPYRRAKGQAFSWQPIRFLKFVMCSAYCLVCSLRMLRADKPSVLVAFGGYLSVSFVLSARLLHIPVVLHEANRIPGRTIRVLARMADRVYFPEGVSVRGLQPSRCRPLGMPIREEVVHIPKERIRQQMGIPNQAKVLVVVGGSQGAMALNQWVQRRNRILAADGIWTILVSGPGKQELPEVEVMTSDTGDTVEVRTFSFHQALHELFSCADVVVSRAGAGSIAEIVTCLAPSILIPYPHAADNHQQANARYLEKRGGCIVVDQGNLDTLYREVMDLIYNDWLIGRMRKNLVRLASSDAAEQISRYLITHYLDRTAEIPSSIERELVHE